MTEKQETTENQSEEQGNMVLKEQSRREAEEAKKARELEFQTAMAAIEQAKQEALAAQIAREKAKQKEALSYQNNQKQTKREAEEAKIYRIKDETIAREIARLEAKEAERAKKQAEIIAQEKARIEAKEAERAKKQAELVDRELAKQEAEEAERARKQAELVDRELAKQEAEEAERAKKQAVIATQEKARQQALAAQITREKAKREAEQAERARKQAEIAAQEKARLEAKEAEKAKRQAELAAREKAKREAEEADRARKQDELIAQEKARLEAEEAEKVKRQAELAAREKAKREAAEAERARKQAEVIAQEKAKIEALAAELASEKAKREAAEAEKVKRQAELVAREKAKREAELAVREKAKREAAEAEKAGIQAELISLEKVKHEGTETQHFKLRKGQARPEALQLLPEAIARKYNVVPLEVIGNVLRVVMANSNDILALEALETITNMRIEPETASIEEVREAIDLSYSSTDEVAQMMAAISLPGEEETTIEDITSDSVDDAPIVKALTVIIDGAIKARASDIHIQPEEDNVRVRYRIDGILHDRLSLPLATAVPIISRLKIMAKMNIADRQRPQDGQISVKPKDRPEMDIRVATIPIVHGEMAALRLLDKSKALMPLPRLGFLEESLALYQEMLKVPYGMILVTGPTGAGKTTTLYASLNTLDRKGRNIITIEDPVEYRFKNINQIQVNPKAGLTFANGLRSILRLDPNVLLVGEMRDAETAGIAIQASLTGHMVLSTIHANDAIGVVARLLDLGIEPFLVASALIGVVAQRMARRICPDCSKLVEAPQIEQAVYTKETGEKRKEFLYGGGCKTCSNTGYQGRIGFYEILRISDVLRAMLLRGSDATELRSQALKDGMIPLIRDGMLKVKAGITTPAEVLRNAYSAD